MNNPKIGSQGTVPVIEATPPVAGLVQQDFSYQDNIDGVGGFPLNLDYFIPVNCQKVVTARLSFKRRNYRTYNNVTGANTGNDSPDHAHGTGNESGHSHSHSHTIPMTNSVPGNSIWWNGSGLGLLSSSASGDTSAINVDTTGSSGHTHGATAGASARHTHALNLSAVLGVTEGVIANTISIKFDGVDQTASLIPAGPYTIDIVEMDVTKFISKVVDRQWHTVSFLPTGLGRVQAALRILYNSNQV